MSTLLAVKVIGLLLAGIVFVVWQLRSVERDLQQSRERRRLAEPKPEPAPKPAPHRKTPPRSDAPGSKGLP